MSNTNEFLGFQILDKLGEGAFSAAYLAKKGERIVAIKVIEIPNPSTNRSLSPQEMQSREFQESLRQTSAELNDILRTLVNIGEKKGLLRYFDYHISLDPQTNIYQLGILTEYLDNLSTHLSKNRMQVRQVLRMGIDLCDGLSRMKEKLIYNGNIKESNIFYDHIKGYKLSDFFFNDILVQSLQPSEAYADYGYRFLAPEAYDTVDYGYKTDIFTLGILLYKLLNNGLLPYQTDSVVLSQRDIRARYMEMKCLPQSPFIESSILDVLSRAAAFRPEERYDDYDKFKSDLREVMRTLELSQLDRILDLRSTYPRVEVMHSSPALPPIAEDHTAQKEEALPTKKAKRKAPVEGVPFTLEVHHGRKNRQKNLPDTEQTLSEEPLSDSNPSPLLYQKQGSTNEASFQHMFATEEEDDDDAPLSTIQRNGFIPGPNEQRILEERASMEFPVASIVEKGGSKKKKKKRKNDDDESSYEPDYEYNYYEEEEEEESSLKNKLSLIVFIFFLVVVGVLLFIFLPYFQAILFGGESSSAFLL